MMRALACGFLVLVTFGCSSDRAGEIVEPIEPPAIAHTEGFGPLGSKCITTSDCLFGFTCVGDWTGVKVCCNSACPGPCLACTSAGTGTKTPNGYCGPSIAGVVCGSEACSFSTYVPPPTCNGSGACAASPKSSCLPGYMCSGTKCATSCKDSTLCAKGYYCSVGACVLQKKLGDACKSPTECTSNSCVDGVCCNTTCTGVCQACSAKAKGTGANGFCEPVAAGTDPDGNCAADPGFPGSCKADGACDGKGACRLFATSTVSCGSTSCSAGTVTGFLCNGSGSCLSSTASCAPYACGGTTCKTTCASDTDCDSKAFCGPSGACVPKRAAGEGCGAGKECDTGFCVDGVCCKSACTAQCEACDVAPNEGNCIPVTGTPHGTRAPCNDADPTCGGKCDGVNLAACNYPPTTTSCGSSCEAGKEKKKTCDGKGTCVDAGSTSCGAYQCDEGTKCKETCGADADCSPGYRCGTDKHCAPASSKCSDDLSSAIANDGTTKSCAPFVCDNIRGICFTQCATSADCAPGKNCDASKNCVGGDAPTGESGGCTVAEAGGDGSGASLLGIGLSLLALGTFRRRIRRSRRIM